MKMRNYDEALAVLDGADEQTLDRATTLRRKDDDTLVVVHEGVEIITFYRRGYLKFSVTTNGNLTTSMRNRITRYSAIDIRSEQGVWFVRFNAREHGVYQDGVQVFEDGSINGIRPAGIAANLRDERKRVMDYVRSMVTKMKLGQVPAPGAEDDLYFGTVVEVDGKQVLFAEAVGTMKGLLGGHIRYARFYPTMIARAIEDAEDTVRPSLMKLADSFWNPETVHERPNRYHEIWEDLVRQFRRYLFRHLALVQ